MTKLHRHKLVSIITLDVLEERLCKTFRKHGVSGYTIVRARGEGASGECAGTLDFEANILVKVIIPNEKLELLMESLERLIDKGYHLTIYVSDIEVIRPEKFSKPMEV